MAVFLAGFILVFAGFSNCQLYQKHVPSSISLQSQALKYSDIFKLSEHLLGFSVVSENVKHTSLFSRPRAIAYFSVETGKPNFFKNDQMKSIEVIEDDMYPSSASFDAVMSANFGEKKYISLKTSDGFSLREEYPYFFRGFPVSIEGILEKVPGLEVDMILGTNPSARNFLSELRTLLHITEKLVDYDSAKDNVPDFFNFHISEARNLLHDSTTSEQVQKVLNAYLNKMTENLKKAYSNNCVVFIVNLKDDILHRQARNLLAAADPTTPPPGNSDNLNLADDYSADFPVWFNIILWTSLAIVLAVYAIAASIWNMDPGKNSIIYRMTTTRLKKHFVDWGFFHRLFADLSTNLPMVNGKMTSW